MRAPDPASILAEALAALDGFSGSDVLPVYQSDASELIARLEAGGYSLTRHAPRAPAVELSRSDLAYHGNISLPPTLAQPSDGW